MNNIAVENPYGNHKNHRHHTSLIVSWLITGVCLVMMFNFYTTSQSCAKQVEASYRLNNTIEQNDHKMIIITDTVFLNPETGEIIPDSVVTKKISQRKDHKSWLASLKMAPDGRVGY